MTDYLGRELAASTTEIIERQLAGDKWREEEIDPAVTGLTRPIRVIRGPRLPRKSLFTFDWHGDKETFCPPKWWDLAIGAGACGLGCRSCFLMLTHRAFNDPMRHRLYDNLADYGVAVLEWLKAEVWPHPYEAGRMVKLDRWTTLGLGIDRSDSLLYEGVTGHARRLISFFVNPQTNPQRRRLVLLTKSANTGYLDWRNGGCRMFDKHNEFGPFADICRAFQPKIPCVSVTFSLNPEQIADKWEGKWPDTLERITPPINDRLRAAQFAQDLGFDVRWRVDPILPICGWEDIYESWFHEAIDRFDAQPAYITLGTYREKNDQLDFWRARWGLPEMEWRPDSLVADGTHWHLLHEERAVIYGRIRQMIVAAWSMRGRPVPAVSLCKETNLLRKELNLCNAQCNCLQ